MSNTKRNWKITKNSLNPYSTGSNSNIFRKPTGERDIFYVLILILLEVTQIQFCLEADCQRGRVLILILLEVTQIRFIDSNHVLRPMCLNPYSTGSNSNGFYQPPRSEQKVS